MGLEKLRLRDGWNLEQAYLSSDVVTVEPLASFFSTREEGEGERHELCAVILSVCLSVRLSVCLSTEW